MSSSYPIQRVTARLIQWAKAKRFSESQLAASMSQSWLIQWVILDQFRVVLKIHWATANWINEPKPDRFNVFSLIDSVNHILTVQLAAAERFNTLLLSDSWVTTDWFNESLVTDSVSSSSTIQRASPNQRENPGLKTNWFIAWNYYRRFFKDYRSASRSSELRS